nr:hypothetical protein [Tanacetum cinerariifolium]
MALTFVDTHNLIVYLTKSDASEGFNQIIDFLNATSIKYSLTVNPNNYVSCIKQFWTSVSVKKVNDVMRLQALVDKKKAIITEATIRDALRLDDAEGIDCLPNEEIFTELARMGYEKPSTKLTFYKAFFSQQWKFLIYSMASAVICLSTGRKSNFSKYIFDSLVRNLDSSAKFYMYPQFLQLIIRTQVGDLSSHTTKYSSPALTQKVFANMKRVGKGCSGVDTPLFEGMIMAPQAGEGTAEGNVDDVPAAGAASVNVDDVPAVIDEPSIPSPTPPTQPLPPSQNIPSTSQVQHTPPPSLIAQPPSPQQQPQPSQDADISMDLLHNLLDTCTTLTRRVENLEQDKIAQALEITKVDTSNDTVMDYISKQGRIIVDMDADVDVTLKDIAKDVVVDAEIKESADVRGSKQNLKHKYTRLTSNMLTRRNKVVIRDPEETTTPSTIIHTEPKSKDNGKGIMVHEPKPLKKKTQIEQDEAYARELEAELDKNIDWDEVIDQVQRKEKEDNAVMRYQALKRKPQTEAQARKNMIIYLRNMAGFKMDYFKGMKYDDIRPIFEKYFNSNVAFLEKTKEKMEEEDSGALKRISESKDDKVAKKQKLDKEVAELKRHLQIVPNDEDDVYTKATPLARKVPVVDYKIYTENNKPYYKIIRADGSPQLFLSFLSLLRNLIEKTWKCYENWLKKERRYPLTRFTLDQMLNNVRLEVEEESEVSLELLRFIRQQQQRGFRPE